MVRVIGIYCYFQLLVTIRLTQTVIVTIRLTQTAIVTIRLTQTVIVTIRLTQTVIANRLVKPPAFGRCLETLT